MNTELAKKIEKIKEVRNRLKRGEYNGNDIMQAWLAIDELIDCKSVLSQQQEAHPDDAAVMRFAEAMKSKMAASRAKGRAGWDDPIACSGGDLAGQLVHHVKKGDPVDIANFCMMIHQRGISGHEIRTAWSDAISQQQEAGPEAWLFERLDGRHEPYSPARRITDAKKFNPMSDDYWAPGAREKYRITPLHPPKPAAQPATEASLVADALEAADWSGVPIGNKCLIRGAIEHLRAAQPQVPEGIIKIERTFEYFSPVTRPKVVVYFAPDDWEAQGRFALWLSAAKEEGK